jgi:hypothetical protein
VVVEDDEQVADFFAVSFATRAALISEDAGVAPQRKE